MAPGMASASSRQPPHSVYAPSCYLEIQPVDYAVITAAAGSPSGPALAHALSVLAVRTDSDTLAAATQTSEGLTVVVPLTAAPAGEKPWSALRVVGAAQPAALAILCSALSEANAEVVLHAVKPSATHLFCRRSKLAVAVAALVGAGCAVRPLGPELSIPHSMSLSTGLLPVSSAGAWQEREAGGLRLLARSGLFVELRTPVAQRSAVVPWALEASRCGYATEGTGTSSVHRAIVDLQPPTRLPEGGGPRSGTGDDSGDDSVGSWDQLDDGSSPTLALELESEVSMPGMPCGVKRRGVWIFVGRRFARVLGPPVGSQQVITGTLCSSLTVLRRVKGKEVDDELSAKYEALLGDLERPGLLRVLKRCACSAGDSNEVLYDESDSRVGGQVEFHDGLLLHTLANGGQQNWRIRDQTFNPFSSEVMEVESASAASARKEADAQNVQESSVKEVLPASVVEESKKEEEKGTEKEEKENMEEEVAQKAEEGAEKTCESEVDKVETAEVADVEGKSEVVKDDISCDQGVDLEGKAEVEKETEVEATLETEDGNNKEEKQLDNVQETHEQNFETQQGKKDGAMVNASSEGVDEDREAELDLPGAREVKDDAEEALAKGPDVDHVENQDEECGVKQTRSEAEDEEGRVAAGDNGETKEGELVAVEKDVKENDELVQDDQENSEKEGIRVHVGGDEAVEDKRGEDNSRDETQRERRDEEAEDGKEKCEKQEDSNSNDKDKVEKDNEEEVKEDCQAKEEHEKQDDEKKADCEDKDEAACAPEAKALASPAPTASAADANAAASPALAEDIFAITALAAAEESLEGLVAGSKVKYWSQTVKRWISATVLQRNADGTFDLDLKRRALAQSIRPAPPAKVEAPDPAEAAAGHLTAEDDAGEQKVKDKKDEKKEKEKKEKTQDEAPVEAEETKKKEKKGKKDKGKKDTDEAKDKKMKKEDSKDKERDKLKKKRQQSSDKDSQDNKSHSDESEKKKTKKDKKGKAEKQRQQSSDKDSEDNKSDSDGSDQKNSNKKEDKKGKKRQQSSDNESPDNKSASSESAKKAAKKEKSDKKERGKKDKEKTKAEKDKDKKGKVKDKEKDKEKEKEKDKESKRKQAASSSESRQRKEKEEKKNKKRKKAASDSDSASRKRRR